ncbi:MAG: hypothetical protein LBG84_05905 [Treponema sp.]|jgi:hypothetical protein|nr:hypothetical protein [Treponema sp.]
MWYKAASVIAAIARSGKLAPAPGIPVPACPKRGNNVQCHSSFPQCEGKIQKCRQRFDLTNERGDPVILYFDYYLPTGEREGRIKKMNTTLRMLITKFQIEETLMVSTE